MSKDFINYLMQLKLSKILFRVTFSKRIFDILRNNPPFKDLREKKNMTYNAIHITIFYFTVFIPAIVL